MIEPARVREILASHGGRNDRWPEREREAMLAALRGDAALRSEREAELRLDALLDEWAGRDLGRGADPRRAAVLALRTPPRWLRWAGGGSIAAAVAAAMLVAPQTPEPAARIAAAPSRTITDEGAFVSLFTTTPDEEDVI
jgi:hypothetical protein